MNIMVTGGVGFVGTNLIKRLLKDGHKVVCLDTVPQHTALDFEYIHASAHLLASGLYKTHQRLVASR